MSKKLVPNNMLLDIDQYVNMQQLLQHSYFSKINTINNENMMLPNDFFKIQIQFRDAVQNWAKILLKLSNKLIILNENVMNDILYDNINDELGKSDNSCKGHNNVTHSDTFMAFLDAIQNKLDHKQYIIKYNSECVNMFNNKLSEIVENESLSYICAYLGTIEYQYILISMMIQNYVTYYNII